MMEDEDQKIVSETMWDERIAKVQATVEQELHGKKRLHLAGMAMQALVAQGSSDVWRIAHQSFAMADAMLEIADSSN